MAARIDEIGDNIFRLSVFVPQVMPPAGFTFNVFLIRAEEPMLFHLGKRKMFSVYSDAIAKLIPVEKLRWASFGHFESDECGALNDWLQIAPEATPVCTLVGKLVTVDDFSQRPAKGMTGDDVLTTGKHRFRFHQSPHIPHGWDAGVLFEETGRTLFCSDLFHHFGNVEAMTESDLIGRTREGMVRLAQGPLAGYMPYTKKTEGVLRGMAELQPKTLAVMHGSSYAGKCDHLLVDLAGVIKESFEKE